MTALNGLFLTAFIPVAVMMIAGIYCLWKYREYDANRVWLFLLTITVLIVIWRLPIVKDRRYMLPVIPFAFIFASLFLKTLCKKYGDVGKWGSGIILLLIMIAGSAKAMRSQEAKPYLHGMAECIKSDVQRNKWDQACVVVIGNLGGNIDFEDTVNVKLLRNEMVFPANADKTSFFELIDDIEPNNLLLYYPVIFIIVSSDVTEDVFVSSWKKRYGGTPELCYEFVREKNQRHYQMFRLISPYKSSKLSSLQRKDVYTSYNLLLNSNFSVKNEFSANSPLLAKIVGDATVPQTVNGNILAPANWHFNQHLWEVNAATAGWSYTPQGKFHLFSQSPIGLFQNVKTDKAGATLQVGGWLKVNEKAYFSIVVILTRDGKYVSSPAILSQTLPPGNHEFFGVYKLPEWCRDFGIQIGLGRGDIEFDGIYLVDESVFKITP
ncbi:MAG: hypothetical protein PHE09_06985 [Oscillospiraceae bacterium]|nr:hypothetical protein [Oscillospiraceae bacterium]